MTNDTKHIPQGYKTSPHGPIPEDWEVKRLGEIANKIGDGIHGTPLYTDKSDYYFINGNNLNDGKIVITEATKCVPYSEYLKYKKELTKNTILISINGSIGNIALYNDEKVLLGKSAAYITIPNYKYFYHFLQSTQVKSIFEKELTGSTIRNLSLDSIRNLKVALPSQVEIDNITKIIDLWDTAIAKQTALIEKLTLRKKGLMQQLLTGKKRLKGFGGEWKEVRLGDVCKITKGTQINSDVLSETGPYPVINGGINPSGYNEDYNTAANTITISEGGNSCGYVNLIQTKFWSGGHCYTISNIVNFDLNYLYYSLKFTEPHIMNLRVGSGLPNIQLGPLQKFTLLMPQLEEQKAIAAIIGQSDKEIEIQKQKLAAMQAQKKGLMQVLLTGKRRI